jgi:hypothetical protein
MNFFNLFILILSIVLTFPLAHIFMKKAIILDINYNKKKSKILSSLFYIPLINVVVSFIYLVWSVVVFKRY